MSDLRSNDLARINIVNVKRETIAEFKQAAKKENMFLPGFFQKVWDSYKKEGEK